MIKLTQLANIVANAAPRIPNGGRPNLPKIRTLFNGIFKRVPTA